MSKERGAGSKMEAVHDGDSIQRFQSIGLVEIIIAVPTGAHLQASAQRPALIGENTAKNLTRG